MPRDFPRTRRVGEQIQRELAELIRDQVRDPRVGSVTVSEVDVTRDFAHAKVFVTQLGAGAEESAEAVEGLNRAAGFLRRELGKRLRLRNVPALKFYYDPAFERGAHLSALINHAVGEDDERQDRDQD